MTARVSVPSLVLTADALAVRSSAVWLWDLLIGLGTPEADQLMSRLELALHEICMNTVDHAGLAPGGTLTLSGSIDEHEVVVEVSDQGRPFDETRVSEPEPGVPQIRGYGLMIVRKLVDELRYVRSGNTNTWFLTVRRNASHLASGGSGSVPTTRVGDR